MGFWTFMTIVTVCGTVCCLKFVQTRYRRGDEIGGIDSRSMQEMNRGLQRMEHRIESLETLLMDRPVEHSSREWE